MCTGIFRAELFSRDDVDYGASGSTELHPRLCPPSPLFSLLIYRNCFFLFFLAVLHSAQHSSAQTARPVSSCMVWSQ